MKKNSTLPRIVKKRNQSTINRSLLVDGTAVATLISPLQFQFNKDAASPDARYVLSRFALCRRSGSDLILESPLSPAYLILHDRRAVDLVFETRVGGRYSESRFKQDQFTDQSLKQLFCLMINAGALTAKNKFEEDLNSSLLQWEFHDLLFHSRSRTGRHSNPYGKTNPFEGIVKPAPAIKEHLSSRGIKLYKPDISRLCKTDPPFTHVLEERSSKREHGNPPVTIRELGELLFRSARIRKVDRVNEYEITGRVYPGSGAAYELEIYPAINRSSGIAPGLYHYCPLNHRLFRICGKTKIVKSLLHSAASTAHTKEPQVLLIISARFQRMFWRYRSISYASILKDVGVLYQTIYLVAAAMGISACALGVGNSDLFAKAAKTDYYEETSVGEFILGR